MGPGDRVLFEGAVWIVVATTGRGRWLNLWREGVAPVVAHRLAVRDVVNDEDEWTAVALAGAWS